ncbi:hypothetical protein BASA81_003423 [Batrachochytrium salamandrivorans]|nr:hypothetical protein BASA81_003423 [Batrachochytrium salamandrivorans]
MASPVAVGGFPNPRPATKDEQSSLGKIWHLALQHHPALNHDYGKTSISSVSSQVVNGTNLAYVVQSDGEAHRIVPISQALGTQEPVRKFSLPKSFKSILLHKLLKVQGARLNIQRSC